ncbi:MAG TPA: hypothetical protein VF427_04440, partial [Noviherbaspirillum sp.]
SIIPLLITTHLVPVPWWLVLINAVAFFVLVSGRTIPGMAMMSASAAPQVRGTFMSLASSMQMLACSVASLTAGLIITRNAAGQIEHYNLVGYLAVTCALIAMWLAKHLKVAGSEQQVPVAAEKLQA